MHIVGSMRVQYFLDPRGCEYADPGAGRRPAASVAWYRRHSEFTRLIVIRGNSASGKTR